MTVAIAPMIPAMTSELSDVSSSSSGGFPGIEAVLCSRDGGLAGVFVEGVEIVPVSLTTTQDLRDSSGLPKLSGHAT